jgi:DNA-binding NarL/FixJ family response regulator
MTPEKIITVLLADDHTMVREGLRALLTTQADIEVIGEAENGREAIRMTERLNPNVVIMDIAMPLLNGLEATRQILKSRPKTKIFILSAHGDDAYVTQAMAVGASGFLIKQTAAHVLPVAIRQIHKGSEFYSPAISKRLIQQESKARLRGDKQTKDKAIPLSSREMEVLQLVAEGKANKQTAAELNISIKTVEKHRQSLMEKLNIHDTAGLTRHAIASGIIESSIQVTIIE